MVLELRPRHGTTGAALREALPVLLAYVLSFVLIGIYWNNHHHMLAAVTRISGMALWANQHLLFWLSLIPVATAWMSQNHFPPIPVAAYGVVLLAAAIGTDVKGRASPLMYGLGIGLSFADRWLGIAAYTAAALMWLTPDRRVERALLTRLITAPEVVWQGPRCVPCRRVLARRPPRLRYRPDRRAEPSQLSHAAPGSSGVTRVSLYVSAGTRDNGVCPVACGYVTSPVRSAPDWCCGQ